jgi:hypothetical protein
VLACSVTVWALLTGDTVAVKFTLIALIGTITVDGRVTAALLLVRLTLNPPLGAASVSVNVQISVPALFMVELAQESVLNVGAADVLLTPDVPLTPEVPICCTVPQPMMRVEKQQDKSRTVLTELIRLI